MRLDELLAELQTRLHAVLATRDRVHSLLEAVVSIGSDLDLETVLRRIVGAATTLVDATYGALGVIGDGKGLIEFIPVGLSEEEIARIEHWPHGLGLLGWLIKDAEPLRLSDIAQHPESYGFPKGHPVMRSFLGVPVRVRDEVFGNLYLTEKRGSGGGDGAAEFTEEDEAVVVALATAAGIAIENARLYAESRRREVWLQASAELATRLLSGVRTDEVMPLMVRQARVMCEADLCVVCFPGQEPGTQRVAIAEGAGADKLTGIEFKIEMATLSGEVFLTGDSVLVPDLRRRFPESILPTVAPIAVGLGVPLKADGGVRGVLALGRNSGRLPFTEGDMRMLEAFAGQAAIALELADARADAERLAVLEDRDRIAKDLHDVVIQRLFAVAMALMGGMRLIQKPEAVARVQGAVDELDATIRQIRSTIFALQATAETGPSLRDQAMSLVGVAREQLGFMPAVTMDGLLDAEVPPEVAVQLLAVLREALTNVVRHARAAKVRVHLAVIRDQLEMQVEDDGVGIPDGVKRSGLRNMHERAEQLGGEMELEVPPTGGTLIRWRVPITS